MLPICPPMARALELRRAEYNARFELARRSHPAIRGARLLEHLREVVNPLIEAVHARHPERVDEVLDALLTLSLELLGQDLLGPTSRVPAIDQAWRILLPAQASLLASAPRSLAGSLTNAVVQLSETPGVDPETWILRLGEASAQAPDLDLDALLELGRIVAWSTGMAHLRDAALAAMPALPAEAVWVALGERLPMPACLLEHNNQARWVAALRDDPWLSPQDALRHADLITLSLKENHANHGRRLAITAMVGGFVGFGGTLRIPPRVYTHQGHLLVDDTSQKFLLSADHFGATLTCTSADLPADAPAPPSPFKLDLRGRVSHPLETRSFPVLAQPRSIAALDKTLAVSLARSHRIFVVALRGTPG